MTSEIWKMCKKAAVQMTDLSCNGKDFMSVIYISTDFMQARDSSGKDGGGAVWLFRKLMNGPALAAIKARLSLSSSDEKRN